MTRDLDTELSAVLFLFMVTPYPNLPYGTHAYAGSTMCNLDSYLEEDMVCVLAENEMSAREVGVVAGYPISSFDWLLRF